VPEILEFWIGQCIVFWLLIIGSYQPVNRRLNILLGFILILVVFINFAGSIRPMQDLNNDIGYVRIQKVRELAAPNDVVLVQDPWLLREFLQYYTPVRVVEIPTNEVQADSIRKVFQSQLQSGKKIFIFIDREEVPRSDVPNFLAELIDQNKGRATLLQKQPAEVWMVK
jgi:hypothetical protein